MKIYHNPRCGKSRKTLELIRNAGKEPEIIAYLKTPPSADQLKTILRQLKFSVHDIIRKNETLYKEQFRGKNFSDDEWINILASNPILIERPIVVEGEKAILGRPPENVQELL